MRTARSIVLAAALTALVPSAMAQAAPQPAAETEKLPTYKEVLDRYIEATGGREAYEKIRTRITTSTMVMKPMDLKATMTLWQKAPGTQVVVMSMPQMGEVNTGTDGTMAWESSAVMGTRLLKDQELKDAINRAVFNLELNYEKVYPKIEIAGSEVVDGQKCYKIVFTPETGHPTTSFYSADSGLLIKTAATIKNQMGDIKTESVVSDYREVDGIKIPHLMRGSAAGIPGEQIITVEKIEHNVEIPADKLQPPAAVQKLLEKAKDKAGETKPEAPAPANPK